MKRRKRTAPAVIWNHYKYELLSLHKERKERTISAIGSAKYIKAVYLINK
jgi:hypothetical protein